MNAPKNPFVGLRPFESDESLLFFGRQQQTIELLEQLHLHHFVAIVGSSGSGKSSLIRAGLIPSLKAGYLIQERDSWMMAVMKPGQMPLYNLAESVITEINGAADEAAINALVQTIKGEGSDALTELLEPLWTLQNKNVFILVDQFEELFRFSGTADTAKRKNEAIDFVNILLELASQPALPVYIVITLRSDFIGECARFYGLPEAMNESQYLVPRLNRTQLKNVITGPIAICGADITPALLNLLLNDIGDDQDQLPILQHALMRTFEVWKEKNSSLPVDVAEYRQTGTMKHALSLHAEEAYSELQNDSEKLVCEKMFKALTDKRIGAKGVRRPQTFSDLLLITGVNAAALSNVINVFRKGGRAFLMPSEKVYLTSATVIDISHESLMRVWDRLVNWVNEESESKQIYLRLSEAAELYAKKMGGLWRNPELQIALLWKEKNAPNTVWAAQVNNSFNQAMQFLDQSQQQATKEERDKLVRGKKRLRNARKVAAAFIILFVAALGVMAYAFTLQKEAKHQRDNADTSAKIANQQRREAERQKINAKSSLQKEQISAQAARDAKDSALQQKQIADSLALVASLTADEAKQSLQIAQNAADKTDSANVALAISQASAAHARDSIKTIAEISENNRKNAEKMQGLERSINQAGKAISQMNENHDGDSRTIAIEAFEENKANGGPAQNATIYKAMYVNFIYGNNSNQFTVHHYPVHCIAGSSNRIFSADERGNIYVSAITGNTLHLLSSKPYNAKIEIRTLAVLPDGNRMAAFSAHGDGFLFDIANDGTLTQTATFATADKAICKSAAFYNNQLFVLSTSGISRFIINNLNKTPDVYVNNRIGAISIINTGAIYVASEKDVFVYTNWDALMAHKGRAILTLNADVAGDICSAVADANERYLAVGTTQGTITIKGLNSNLKPASMRLHQSAVNDLKFAAVTGNRLQLASAGADKMIKLIDVESFIAGGNTDEVIVLEGHSKWVYQLCYKSDGKLLFSCGEDDKIMIWKPTMTDLYQTLKEKQ